MGVEAKLATSAPTPSSSLFQPPTPSRPAYKKYFLERSSESITCRLFAGKQDGKMEFLFPCVLLRLRYQALYSRRLLLGSDVTLAVAKLPRFRRRQYCLPAESQSRVLFPGKVA